VGLVNWTLRPRHYAKHWKRDAWRQREECDDFDKLGNFTQQRAVNFGGSSFALLAPCSRRPSGHRRWASFALPSASVRMTHL
jgi:hypothetical protein